MSGYTGHTFSTDKFTPAGIIHKASYQLPIPEGVTPSWWMQNGPWFEGGFEEWSAHMKALGDTK